MEIQLNNNLVIPESEIITQSNNPFIEANTKNVSLSHLEKDCTIPVFSKDNECTISHHQFVNTTYDCVKQIFHGQKINFPELRTSHTIKGRIPSAIGKPVKELLEQEKTIYYERMMFKIDIPSICEQFDNNELCLTIGGVRAYNQENLYNNKSLEKFKLFIGFKNRICTNLCLATDGSLIEIKVLSVSQLKDKILDFIGEYNMQDHLSNLKVLKNYTMDEQQFARFIGKCRLYQHLPNEERLVIPELKINDGQVNAVAKGYYHDQNFKRLDRGDITYWNLYNLLTSANKSSYIDTFLERSINASAIVKEMVNSIESGIPSWYLN